MPKVIYKYPLLFGDECEVEMPRDAEVISAAIQGRYEDGAPTIQVWAVVNPHAPTVRRTFYIRGAGGAPDAQHIATMMDGRFVWHVFDGGQREG